MQVMRLDDCHPDSSSYRADYSISIFVIEHVNGSNLFDFWRVSLLGINFAR